MDTRLIALWFTGLFGRGTRRAHELIEVFGSPSGVFSAGGEALRRCGVLREKEVRAVLAHDTREAELQYKAALREGCRLLTPEDEEYPDRLRHIYSPPAVLFVRGSLTPLAGRLSVAVVGARHPDEYGLAVTTQLAGALAAAGVVVVSGMAVGTDQAAHRAAIQAEGLTIGVLGCGLDLDCPRGSRPLREMAVQNGALISEYPIGFPAHPGHFPMRNRIISGLADGVLVVRADEYSGSLITAGHALSQGRDVFAVPGRIDEELSRGVNKLIQQGAKPVMDVGDILEEYTARPEYRMSVQLSPEPVQLRPGSRPRRSVHAPSRQPDAPAVPQEPAQGSARRQIPDYLSPDQAALLRLLGDTPERPDRLALRLDRPVPAVLSMLTELEIYGLIENHGPAGYTAR